MRRRGEPASTYLRAAGLGLLAGAGGAAVMTAGEKLEQRLTGRPDSYVPARTLGHLLGLPEVHREVAPPPLRLSTDQTLENATGVGAPPWTWPRDELVIDVAHKAVYALATGAFADALVRPAPRSSARRRLLGLRLSGRA